MLWLEQSTAATVAIGPAVAIADGVTPVTSLASGTVDEIGVYKAGATALTDLSGTAITHRAGGMYTIPLPTGAVGTLGPLVFFLRDDTACLPIRHEYIVVPSNVYNMLVDGAGTPWA
jgi:hypothetical protein